MACRVQENSIIRAFVPRFQKGQQVIRVIQRLHTRERRVFIPTCALRNDSS